MPIVAVKPITVVYNTGDPSARTTVTIGLETAITHEHIVSLLFDDSYLQWWYAGLPISGWNDFAFPVSASTQVFEVKFRSNPSGVGMLPPMPYVVSSTYAPAWAKIYGNIDVIPDVVVPAFTHTWLSAWLRPWKILGV